MPKEHNVPHAQNLPHFQTLTMYSTIFPLSTVALSLPWSFLNNYFLGKMLCYVDGRVKQKNLVLSNDLIKAELPPWNIWKADLWYVSPSSERSLRFWNCPLLLMNATVRPSEWQEQKPRGKGYQWFYNKKNCFSPEVNSFIVLPRSIQQFRCSVPPWIKERNIQKT